MSLTGRFDSYQPAIQSIPIPEGVSDFMDELAHLQRQMSLGMMIPAELLVERTPAERRCALNRWKADRFK